MADVDGVSQPAPEETKQLNKLDQWANNNILNRMFALSDRRTTLSLELRAGLVCFLTVAYIIPVNSGILSDSGGSCNPATDCNPERYEIMGDACKFDDPITNPEWAQCISVLKQNLISATCIASAIGTYCMVFLANMPMAVAPAMGVNAFFSYNVVGFMGTGMITYEAALAAAFVEGCIFIVISATGIRQKFIELVPQNLLYATATGIGCFLCFIGLQKSEGLGFITYDGATLVKMGACPPDEQGYMYQMRSTDAYWHDLCWQAWRDGDTANNLTCGTCGTAYDYLVVQEGMPTPVNLVEACQSKVFSFNPDYNIVPAIQLGLPPKSANYGCMGKVLRSPTFWLGVCGGLMMVLMMLRGINASILWGILFVTIISWIPNPPTANGAAYFGAGSPIRGGEDRLNYFKKVVTVPSLDKTLAKFDFSALQHGDTWIALITFMYLDFMDATSTMYAMASLINDTLPGFLNWKGQWPRQKLTMLVDGIAIVMGSIFGTSPLTIFAESSVGIKEGGKTGVTALVIAVGFTVAMFFAPIFASIPPYATGPAIVFVGALMFEHARYIEWHDVYQAVPSFLTIILMPLTYSVAYGVLSGIFIQMSLWILNMFTELVWCVGIKKNLSARVWWLKHNDHFYRMLGKEQMLVDEVPGYVPKDPELAAAQAAAAAPPSEKPSVIERKSHLTADGFKKVSLTTAFQRSSKATGKDI